jgi:hypothetical protein
MTRTLRTTAEVPRAARRPAALRARAAAAAAFALLGAAACTDVTTEPRSAIGSNNAFGDASAYRAAVGKLYGTLALSGQNGAGEADIQGIDAGFGQYVRVYWNLQQLPTDETVLAWNDQSAGVQDLNTQRWTPSNGSVTAMYARILLQVTLAAEFLRQTTGEQVAARGASSDLRAQVNTYRAEARFLRALSYWHALDMFGRIPLVTEETPIGAAAPPQASRQELFDFVVRELTTIRDSLPAANRADGTQYGRATRAAADMLLSKVFLNAQVYTGSPRWADAQAAAARVIQSGAFSLDPNYQRMFLADNHTSPELVFVVPQDGARTQNFGGTTYLTHASIGNQLNDNATRDFGIDGGWFGLRTRPEFVALFPAALANDVRGRILFGSGQTLNITNLTEFGQGYLVPKYRNVTTAGRGGGDLTFTDIDFPMFRLADAYLMFAEAVVRNNGNAADRATALGYVNALRTRANSPTITDAQLTTAFLLDERARELFWEAHRRTDLIRFGAFTGGTKLWQFKGGAPNGVATAATFNLYPIPTVEIAAAGQGRLTQNPGY